MADAPVESFTERAKRRIRERDGIPEPAPTPEIDPRHLVTLDDDDRAAHKDDELDEIIKGLSIVDAYNKWVNKPEAKPGGGVEIKVSCPLPGHDDDVFSACLNTEKNLWNCYVCEEGGDIYDFAAYRFGYDPKSYKKDGSFPKLKRDIAEDLGYSISRSSVSGKEYVVPSAPPGPPEPVTRDDVISSPRTDGEGPSTVTELSFDDENYQNEEYKRMYTIDWRSLLPENTFMRRWCEIGAQDDLPEEFYFWLGLSFVGCALGRDTYLEDNPRVYSNLFLALLGSSGLGKSKSIKAGITFIRKALPYDESHPAGTLIVPSPGSAEALIDNFSCPVTDDATKEVTYQPIRGIVRFEEFSTLTGRSARMGSVMKPTLMDFYDGYGDVELKTRGVGLTKAADPFCTVLTTTQPRTLSQIFAQSDADSGFLNRWVFARGVSKQLFSAFAKELNFDDCIDLLRDIRAWGSSHEKVSYTPAGFKAWDAFFHEKCEPLRTGDKAILARVDLTLKKVLLILAADGHQDQITPEIVERTAALYNYLVYSYGEINSALGMGETEECIVAIQGRLVKWARAGKPDPTAREIIGSLKRYPHEMIVRALSVMVAAGTIHEYAGAGSRGPATTRYKLVA